MNSLNRSFWLATFLAFSLAHWFYSLIISHNWGKLGLTTKSLIILRTLAIEMAAPRNTSLLLQKCSTRLCRLPQVGTLWDYILHVWWDRFLIYAPWIIGASTASISLCKHSVSKVLGNGLPRRPRAGDTISPWTYLAGWYRRMLAKRHGCCTPMLY